MSQRDSSDPAAAALVAQAFDGPVDVVGAVRWPERELLFDDGSGAELSTPDR